MENEKPWTNFINWFAIRPRITGFLLFLILSICIIALSLLRNKILKEEERNEINSILADAH
jgi:diguanylate cyclase